MDVPPTGSTLCISENVSESFLKMVFVVNKRTMNIACCFYNKYMQKYSTQPPVNFSL